MQNIYKYKTILNNLYILLANIKDNSCFNSIIGEC